MAHYENFAARLIDYSNHLLFESFFEFFVYGKTMAHEYWEYYKPDSTAMQEIDSVDPNNLSMKQKIAVARHEHAWKVQAILHYLFSFLIRLILLPLTALVYTVSRTVLIVCNPFTAWFNNPRKVIYMGLVWAVPGLIAMNNHVHQIMPDLRFSALLTSDHFQGFSNALSLSNGFWGMGSTASGALISSIFLSMGMACLLFLAKTAAQKGNAVKFTDPKQTNSYDPAVAEAREQKRKLHFVRAEAYRDFVMITSPKHRHIAIADVHNKKICPESEDPFNNMNSASANLRYACYQNRANRPIIWSTTPHSIKRYLSAFDELAKEVRESEFKKKTTALFTAYAAVRREPEPIHEAYRLIPLKELTGGKKQ